jgi:selenium-binding protein 1
MNPRHTHLQAQSPRVSAPWPDRRSFLQAGVAFSGAALFGTSGSATALQPSTPGFASPQQALQAPREKILFVACTYANTGVDQPDYLAVVDVDPSSP